ncbi:MAG: DsbE family thiol:disulfide interchange protein [Pseudomonadota bacterium]|nr:DsbE family thiol:disulfide interchange protein [Pseudomonadota bacterium]
MSAAETPQKAPVKRFALVALPLILFGAIAAVFGIALHQNQLGRDITEIPSVLIGKAAPKTVLPPLDGVTTASGAPIPGLDLASAEDGRPLLVNVFASWCAPCRQEHPLLMELAKDDRFRLVAINYKDKPQNARDFLSALGNPYEAIGVDQKGSATIDWGVYGVPESFLVSPDGTILYKRTGPFTVQSIQDDLLPAVEKAIAKPAPTS